MIVHRNFLARKDTQPALLLGVITATPCEKVELEILSRAVQRVSHHFDAPRGPSASGGSPPVTATPCKKVDTLIISKAVQRVSRQFGAPSGPSPSGGSLSFTCQPTGETHSKSLRFQGSPLVPPSLGGAVDLGPSDSEKVRYLFLGQDSLVQAPVLKKPAYSTLPHCPLTRTATWPLDCPASSVTVSFLHSPRR